MATAVILTASMVLAAVGTSVVLQGGPHFGGRTPAPTVADPEPEHELVDESAAQAEEIERLMALHDCSDRGLVDGAVPVHAVVTTPDGEVLLVDFAEGWAVHQGELPGTLNAVCGR